MILGGNMRFKALKELGYKEVPDEWIKRDGELTDEEKQRFIIADNVQIGEWEWGLLKEWHYDEIREWGNDFPEFKVILDDEKINIVNKGNENDEWVGFPDLTKCNPGVNVARLFIIWNTVKERDKFIKDTGLNKYKVEKNTQGWKIDLTHQSI
jgi:hypothetical protein